MSKTTADVIANLGQCALWYGWGRQDSAHDARVDVLKFAEHYQMLAAQPQGRPSIQQAWADFVAALPALPGERPARTAPITEINDYFMGTVSEAHPDWDFDRQFEAAERLTFRYVR